MQCRMHTRYLHQLIRIQFVGRDLAYVCRGVHDAWIMTIMAARIESGKRGQQSFTKAKSVISFIFLITIAN